MNHHRWLCSPWLASAVCQGTSSSSVMAGPDGSVTVLHRTPEQRALGSARFSASLLSGTNCYRSVDFASHRDPGVICPRGFLRKLRPVSRKEKLECTANHALYLCH